MKDFYKDIEKILTEEERETPAEKEEKAGTHKKKFAADPLAGAGGRSPETATALTFFTDIEKNYRFLQEIYNLNCDAGYDPVRAVSVKCQDMVQEQGESYTGLTRDIYRDFMARVDWLDIANSLKELYEGEKKLKKVKKST